MHDIRVVDTEHRANYCAQAGMLHMRAVGFPCYTVYGDSMGEKTVVSSLKLYRISGDVYATQSERIVYRLML
jgi:hypothetical protein